MKNKPNFFLITGISQTGGGGRHLGIFPTQSRFFSDRVPKLQKHKMTYTGEKAHIPSLPYARTKIEYTNEDAHRVEVLQIQPVRLHLHWRR